MEILKPYTGTGTRYLVPGTKHNLITCFWRAGNPIQLLIKKTDLRKEPPTGLDVLNVLHTEVLQLG
jgi:hypothetical protein